MAQYPTHKRTAAGKSQTLARRAASAAKRQQAPKLTDTARAIGLNPERVTA